MVDFMDKQLGKGNNIIGVKVGRVRSEATDEVGVPINAPKLVNGNSWALR
jgi:hypothetical protein